MTLFMYYLISPYTNHLYLQRNTRNRDLTGYNLLKVIQFLTSKGRYNYFYITSKLGLSVTIVFPTVKYKTQNKVLLGRKCHMMTCT